MFGLIGSALIFSSIYFNHKEKTELIDKCYEKNGTPSVESADKADVSGTTKSASAKSNGGYKFEFVK